MRDRSIEYYEQKIKRLEKQIEKLTHCICGLDLEEPACARCDTINKIECPACKVTFDVEQEFCMKH